MSRVQQDRDCFVYIISIDELGIVKVGISDNPAKRLRQLRTGSPFRMDLAHAFRLASVEGARELEKAFHSVHKGHRSNGEWFRMTARDAAMQMACNIVVHLSNAGVRPEHMMSALEIIEVPKDLLGVAYLAFPGAIEEVKADLIAKGFMPEGERLEG